ncbi:MAG: alpha/beta hydrolase family protein, partial [Solirubrobacteraceae bacterium]
PAARGTGTERSQAHGDGPHPVAVLLHGGFWRARFDRSTLAALAVDLALRGWASWNVEYRRAGVGGGPLEALADVRAALARLPHLGAPLAHDRVVLIGHSAGGQLALCLAGEPLGRAVVSLAGVCDLGAAAREAIGEDATVQFMGGSPEQVPDLYAVADPVRRAPTGAAVLLAHGDRDQRVPLEQSRSYLRAALAGGDRCELLELPGADHFDLIDPRTEAWGRIATQLAPLALRGAATVA